MSNTRLQKEHKKYNNGLIKTPSIKLQRKFDRHNFDVAYDRHLKNKIIDKQELELMKEELWD
jgi:hypothetical protein